MVGLAGFKMNPALSVYLQERQEKINKGVQVEHIESALTPAPKQRPLSARFGKDQVAKIVEQYRSGATARSLATEYGVGLTAMKSLLRREGARKM